MWCEQGASGSRVNEALTGAVDGCGCEVYKVEVLGYEDYVPAKLPPETSPLTIKYRYITRLSINFRKQQANHTSGSSSEDLRDPYQTLL